MAAFQELPRAARRYVIGAVALGGSAVLWAVVERPPVFDFGSILFILLAAGAGLIKVRLPVVGSLSLAYTFVFATLMGFGLGASIFAGVLSAIASGLIVEPTGTRQSPYRILFNSAVIGGSSAAAGSVYLLLGGTVGTVELPAALLSVVGYTAIFSLTNIGLIAGAVHFSGRDRIVHTLRTNLRWSGPGYVAGSSLATILVVMQAHANPALILLGAPFVYLVHLTYRTRTEIIEEDTRHSKQTAQLYLGITEALARAVEAKDENTEEHLHRVQEYSLGIGELLGLPQSEMEALRAASLLHDIGKIAVPEYILTKPGKLTAEEVEIMKIHPRVGAEILSAVPFPYPLAPIVRHHHERWDGTGYPDGIAGEAIPLGARILTAVDCYDALTSDRPYRKAIRRDDALDYLRKEAGNLFDPRIVDLLTKNVERLEERLLKRSAQEQFPAPVYEIDLPQRCAEATSSDAELSGTLELERLLGALPSEASVENRLHAIADPLQRLIPYRTVAIYLFDETREALVARFVQGDAAGTLEELRIAVGERQAGWAALHQRPYRGKAHDNPLERDGSRFDLEDLVDHPDVARMRCAAVAPLTSEIERVGVLALYDHAEHEYSDVELRQLERVAALLARDLPSLRAVLESTATTRQ